MFEPLPSVVDPDGTSRLFAYSHGLADETKLDYARMVA